jgi:chromosomal replication initiation ATPase DnaA
MATQEQIETFSFVFRDTHGDIGAALDAATARSPKAQACKHTLRLACEYLDVDPGRLIRGGRTPSAANARHVSMWVLREYLGASYPTIGEVLGGMNHTSVLHGCRRVERTPALLAKAREVLAAIEVRKAA